MRFIESRKITAVLLTVRTAKQPFNVGTHLDKYQWIWFKLGMIIETIEVYIFISVCVTFDQDSRSGGKQRFIICQLSSYPPKFSMDLDGIWNDGETYWSDERHLHLVLSDSHARERIPLTGFHKDKN